MSTLPASAARVQDALDQAGITVAVQTFPSSTRTAADAADAIGCSVGQIAKSLVFRAAEMFGDPVRLGIAQVVASHARLLAEREPHPDLYARVLNLFDVRSAADALTGLVQFECDLLSELGFGLDLSTCAATGGHDDLVYVSPKSGRAVSRQAGAPYDAKLLALPSFLVERINALPTADDIRAGFLLTGFFLERHIYGPRRIEPPIERARLMRLAAGEEANAPVAAPSGEG